MTWTLPAAGWLLLLAVPIVLWHIHRRRRVRVVVPSLLAFDAGGAGAPPRRARTGRLRDQVGLLLELAALAALAAAAAGPVSGGPPPPARPLVIVLDASASTGASDGRWAEMTAAAERALEAAGPATPVTVVRAAAEAAVIARPEDGAATARAALASVEPRLAGSGSLARAAEAAVASGARVVVITDGCDDEVPALAARTDLDLVSVGRPAVNAGVVGAAVERSRLDPPVAFLQVRRPDGESVEVPWPVTGGTSATFRERAGFAGVDVLAADDPPRLPAGLPAVRVAVRAPGGAVDPYLAAALEAAVPPVAPEGSGVIGAGADLPDTVDVVVVLDGRPEPGRACLVLDVGTGTVTAAPTVLALDATHPVLRGVDPAELVVTRGRVLPAEPGDAVLLRGPDGPLALAGERAGARIVLLGFRPTESTLPLGAGWPVLVRNALDWLGGGDPGWPAVLRAGTPAAMPWTGSPPESVVLAGGGTDRPLPFTIEGGVLRFDVPVPPAATPVAVVIRDRDPRRSLTLAVALLDARESDLAPRVPRNLEGWTPPAGPDPGDPPRPWAPELALLGVLFLVAEALWWARRSP